MATPALDLETKKLIETLLENGHKCPSIAKELGLSVWVVRKWAPRIKKKLPYSCYGSPHDWHFRQFFFVGSRSH
jgi:transposase